jgi:hypothetical protein
MLGSKGIEPLTSQNVATRIQSVGIDAGPSLFSSPSFLLIHAHDAYLKALEKAMTFPVSPSMIRS